MKKIIGLLLVVIMITSLLVGCQPNEDSGDTIKIGLLGPYSGEYAQYGLNVRDGALLYINEVNAAGGINGKQIKAIQYDQKANSTEALNAFSRMVEEDGITALIGDVLTGNTIAVAGEAYDINMPMISASATAPAVTYNEEKDILYTNVFRACFIDPFQGIKMAEYAFEVLEVKSAGIIFETGNDYSVGVKDAFVKRAGELGLEVLATEGYATGDKDFKSQLTNISSKDVETVFAPIYYEDAGLIVKQAREIGLDVPFLGGDGWSSVSQYATAEELEGSLYASAFASGATEAMTEFEEKFTKAYSDRNINMFSALGYDSAVILIDAIKKAEDTDHETGSDEYKQAIIDGMKNTSVEGITGKYEFDEFNNPIKEAVIIELKGGKEVFKEMY